MDLESAARELKMLAAKERLTAAELDRAKNLMVELKWLGMSNLEISEFTGGHWSESAVKGYTRGVRAIESGPWKSTTALFSEMQAKNLSLDDVKETIVTKKEVEAMGSSLADVVDFMADLKEKQTDVTQLNEAVDVKTELEQAGTSPSEIADFTKQLRAENIDVPAFVSLFRDWREAGLTPTDARLALGYRTQLEQASIDITTASHIAEAARKFGAPGEVLKAVTRYGSLMKLDKQLKAKEQELEATSNTLDNRKRESDAANRGLEAIEKKRAAIDKELATYKRLQAKGFNEKALQDLAEVADKYGDRDKVLAALNAFADLFEIQAAYEEVLGKIWDQEAVLDDLKTKQSHLRSATETCQALLFKHGFSLDVITAILTLAKVYSDPISVLEAVESYGKRKALDEEARQLEVRIGQLKKTESQYEARVAVIVDQFEQVNVKAIELGRTLGSVEEKLKQDGRAREIVNLLQNPMAASYEHHAPLVLALVSAIRVWVSQTKSKFGLAYSAIDHGLENLVRNLGGS